MVVSGLWMLQAASVVQKLSVADVVERKSFVVASGLWLSQTVVAIRVHQVEVMLNDVWHICHNASVLCE